MKHKDVLAAVNISIDESSKSAGILTGNASKTGTQRSKSSTVEGKI